MGNIKKLLALLLCAGLLMTSIPLQARAETKLEQPDTGFMHYVNPLYADLVDESAVLLASDDYEMPVLHAEDYYTTLEAAGAHLRKQMVDRVTTVSVGLKTKESDLYNLAYTLMDEAMKHTGVPNEGDYIQWQYSGWKGNYSRSTSGGYNMVTYTFTMNYFTTAAQEQQVDNKLNQIYAQLNVNNASDYNKVKAIYDYICSNITYDYANLNDDSYKLKHSAWAGLINNTCVCQGYALIFYRMALNYGVDARLIAGDGGGPHGWNIVKLGNLYYNVDSTWDAGSYYYRYFLKGSNNFTDHQGWEDFTTAEFMRQYPISPTDFVTCEGSTDRNKHQYSSKTTVEPTCTTTGTATEYCSVCGVKGNTTTLPALGHNYQSGYCTRCGNSNIPTSGSCGESAYWSISGSVLSIYGSGALAEYNGVSAPWSASADKIKNVVIGEGITHVGYAALKDMTSVTGISLPSTLRSIGGYAFANCRALKEISIPTGVSIVGEGAFNMCTSLTSVTLPQSLTKINQMVFGYCTSLTNLTIPARVTEVMDSAFYSSGIKNFTFKGEAPVFGGYAFNGVKATVVYPADMPSWQSVVSSSYGGNITWRMEGAPLSAPVLKGNVTSSGQVKLTWGLVTGAVKYDIFRAVDGGSFGYCGTSYTNLYTDTSAQVGKDYSYYVVASDGTASSPSSNIVNCKITLAAPTVTSSNVTSSGKIKLTWNKIDKAKEYKVYRATSKTGKYSLMKTVTTGTSYTNTSATPGKYYYYYVVAVASNGAKSDKSNIVGRTCDLAKPTGLSLSNVASSGKIKVSWKKVDGASKYQVYRATSKSGTYSSVKTTTSLSWTDTNTTAGKTYYYKVKAVHSNSSANSVLTGYKSRMADLKAPVVKITTSSGKPKVSWATVTNAKQYKIYRATSKNGTYKLVKTTTSKSWKDTTAKKGKTYYYKVIAVHKTSSANSAYSNVVSKKCTK